MSERILNFHAKGDVVHVDWFDGKGPRDVAVVLDILPGQLTLRFMGEPDDRHFSSVDVSRGLWRSPEGQVVEVGRDA